MQITTHSTSQILNTVRIGDLIEDNNGNSGKVTSIEVLTKTLSVQYYFRLHGGKTILIIK